MKNIIKRLTALCAVLILMLSMTAVPTASAQKTAIPGDVGGDGELAIGDV